jgi:hypothetical protein
MLLLLRLRLLLRQLINAIAKQVKLLLTPSDEHFHTGSQQDIMTAVAALCEQPETANRIIRTAGIETFASNVELAAVIGDGDEAGSIMRCAERFPSLY